MTFSNVNYLDAETTNNFLTYYSFCAYNKVIGNMNYYYFKNFEATKILENVYLGNICSSYDYETLKKLNITHIVSVIAGYVPPFPNDFKYLVINALDDENTNLYPTFDLANKFIEECYENGGNVLIHCKAGRSRSVCILGAYIVSMFGMHPSLILDIIRKKRPIIEPNPYFVKQLEMYYKEKYDFPEIV